MLAPLMIRAYYPTARGAQALLWLALAQAAMRDVLERQHYSVDMLLAVVVTWAAWDWLEWVYPAGGARALPRRQEGGPPPARLHPAVFALIAFTIFVAGVIVFVGKA